jgi:Ser/Thr protein kinase RdoA (MazF antagonist)
MTAVVATGLARDEAVPTRDELLEPAVFAEAVAAASGLRAQVAARRRLRATYQVGRSLRVVHELDVDGSRQLVAARTFERSLPELFDRAREHAGTNGPLPPVLLLEDLGAVAWVYPNDRKVRGLLELPETIASLLRRDGLTVELVAWAPEKSATVVCTDSGSPLAFAKAYATEVAARTSSFHNDLHARLAGADTVAIPRALGSSANVLAVENADGTPLAQLDGSAAVAAYARFGRALATLHSIAPPAGAEPFRRLRPERVASAAALIGRIRPDVSEAVLKLARELVEHASHASGHACLHGDAHPKNAIDDGARVALIDLDQVAAGTAAAELGGVLAGIGYRTVTGEVAEETAGIRERAFLDEYAGVGQLPDTTELAWHTAAALLVERAARSVTRVRTEGLRRLPELVAEARATLAEGRS